jgi:uncharacterized protein YutE (UPF0331/DUF86 family)/predicted nucleotidyltransferase
LVFEVIIKDRLAFAKNYIKVLYELRSRVKEPRDIIEDYILRGAIERYLHLALEAIIDVGMRLASTLGLKKPERYRDVARVFRDCGAIDVDDMKRLELWIGLRNILVHGYAEIDYEKLYQALSEIDELELFVEKIYECVEGRDIDPQAKTLEGIVGKVREVLERKENVIFAYVFGSYATGKYIRGSDIDIAVYTKKPLKWRELIELALELEDSLGVEVDVVDLRTAPLLLAYEVISKGVVVVERDKEERIGFETRVLKEYLDLKPRLERYYSEVLSKRTTSSYRKA